MKRGNHLLAQALIPFAVAILCGCGQQPSQSVRQVNQVQACTLLTDDEAAAALGMSVQSASPSGPSHGNQCAWVNAADNNNGISIAIMDASGFPGAKAASSVGGATGITTPMSGIGDEAYFSSFAQGPPHELLNVKKGNVFLQISVDTAIMTAPQRRDAERQVALKALGRS